MSTPPPSPSPLPVTAPLPTLTTHPATTNDEKVAALRLVADSVAQQRQAASRALITHPLPVSLALLLLALIAQYASMPLLFTTGAGVVMSLLVAVRGATGGYLAAAEEIGWVWLDRGGRGDEAAEDEGSKSQAKDPGDETVVLVTLWGEEVIGTVVLRILKREQRALVRAWTVGLRYRGKGVGRALLEEGVKTAAGKGCGEVEFDKGHASEILFFLLFCFGSRLSSILRLFIPLYPDGKSIYNRGHPINLPSLWTNDSRGEVLLQPTPPQKHR